MRRMGLWSAGAGAARPSRPQAGGGTGDGAARRGWARWRWGAVRKREVVLRLLRGEAAVGLPRPGGRLRDLADYGCTLAAWICSCS